VSSPPSTIVLRYTAVSTTLYCRTKHAYADASFAGRASIPTGPNTEPNRRWARRAPLPDADAADTP
jgi:hypothetical protein